MTPDDLREVPDLANSEEGRNQLITPVALQQNPSAAQAVEPDVSSKDPAPNRGINREHDSIAARGDVPEARTAENEVVTPEEHVVDTKDEPEGAPPANPAGAAKADDPKATA